MQDFRASEPASAIGENPISVADAEHRDRVLAKARDILARRPTAAEIEADEARRQRLAGVETMPDLATLQARWIAGDHLSDAQFSHMRRLETLAKIAPPSPPKQVGFQQSSPLAISRRATENLLDRARKHELELKVKSGGKWTDQERAEWWLLHSMEIGDKADRLVRRNKVSDAIFLLVKELAIVSISQARNRERLEGRVAALEPKPRIRVKAVQQVIP